VFAELFALAHDDGAFKHHCNAASYRHGSLRLELTNKPCIARKGVPATVCYNVLKQRAPSRELLVANPMGEPFKWLSLLLAMLSSPAAKLAA
jgi:hypothetical protein